MKSDENCPVPNCDGKLSEDWLSCSAGHKLSYEFEEIGSKSDDIIRYMHKLAKEDGFDLNEVVKRLNEV